MIYISISILRIELFNKFEFSLKSVKLWNDCWNVNNISISWHNKVNLPYFQSGRVNYIKVLKGIFYTYFFIVPKWILIMARYNKKFVK